MQLPWANSSMERDYLVRNARIAWRTGQLFLALSKSKQLFPNDKTTLEPLVGGCQGYVVKKLYNNHRWATGLKSLTGGNMLSAS